jgi:uncharacterized protein YrrD
MHSDQARRPRPIPRRRQAAECSIPTTTRVHPHRPSPDNETGYSQNAYLEKQRTLKCALFFWRRRIGLGTKTAVLSSTIQIKSEEKGDVNMRKGKSLLGLKVISEVDGTDMGSVKDLIFDHDSNQVLALLMSDKDLFGLIDAQIIPWEHIAHVGPDAITVTNSNSRINAGSDARVKSVMDRDTALSGTYIYSTEGQYLGTLADTYLNEETGHIEGYEISGGFVSDTMTGKRFLPSDHDLQVGKDVALVDPVAADALETQKQNEPGGLSGAAQTASGKVGDAYESARESVTDAYSNIASASVEKQKEYVIGKTAAHDVVLPAENLETPNELREQVPGAAPSDVTSSGEVVAGEVLVREGETITAQQADRAADAGVLGHLVTAAVGGVAGEAVEAGKEKVSGAAATGSQHAGNAGASLQEKAEAAAIGKTAAREVRAEDGTTLVAEGQTVTQAILDNARLHGKEKEVLAVAGLGAVSRNAQDLGDKASETAGNLWDSARQKVNELTHAAREKKEEYDQAAEQSKINHALGRPTTRVILDQNDDVILNTGDIITHAAVNRSREAGVLPVLLDSVYDETPEITPEMMRAEDKGQAALEGQQDPDGEPNTATVAPEVQSQSLPTQDLR